MILLSQKKNYEAFGLTIISEMSFPELCEINGMNSEEDVLVEKVDLNELWEKSYDKKSRFVTNDKYVMFKVTDTAIFLIEGGKRIAVSPIEKAGEDKIRLFILGTCMSILLMQRRILPLHGSAIEIGGKAYAFIGKRGAGKSTLASAFINKGFNLISDDIVAVSLYNNEIPYVIPSYPQQKLWEESLFHFGHHNHNYDPLFERETKYAVPVQSDFTNKKLPLAGIFELIKNEKDDITLNRIQGLDQFYTLYLHTFRNFLIPRLGLMEWHFKNSSIFINHLNMNRINRPTSWFSANHLVDLILNSIKQGEYK